MKTLTKAELYNYLAECEEKGVTASKGLEKRIPHLNSEWGGVYWKDWAIIQNCDEGFEYRIKIKTHTVNGYEVPAPETEEPNIGDSYYTPSPHNKDWCYECVWTGSADGNRKLNRGLVHLSDDSAVANSKAMAKVDPFSG